MSDHYEIIAFKNSTEESFLEDSLKLKDVLKNLNLSDGEILAGRQIFHEMEGAEFYLTCHQCMKVFDGFQEPLATYIGDFYEGSVNVFTCPHCQATKPLRFCDTQGFACGFLGINFNRRDPLPKELIEQISSAMGSAVTVIHAHL